MFSSESFIVKFFNIKILKIVVFFLVHDER